MTVTSNDILNEAIQYIGDNQPPVTGQAPTFDSSPAGVAGSKFYTAVVQTVARQFAWDFSRNTFPLVLSGNPATDPFLYEYLYPSNAIQIWQLKAPSLSDPNNPLPVNWQVANTLVNNVQTKVIQTNLQNAVAVMNNNPSESVWDAGFREAVVRLLSSVMAMALAGKPDAAQAYLDSAGQFEQVAEARGN
jgi:hypothetical protein